jgi:hypothetical protein
VTVPLQIFAPQKLRICFDAGDTIVRIRNATVGVLFSDPSSTSDTTHSFQFSVGFGYRF